MRIALVALSLVVAGAPNYALALEGAPLDSTRAIVMPVPSHSPATTNWFIDIFGEELQKLGQGSIVPGDLASFQRCTGSQTHCLTVLAASARAARVFLVDVKPRQGDYLLTLREFDARKQSERSRVETIRASPDGLALSLRSRAYRFLTGIAAKPHHGGVLVRSQRGNATVFVDGEEVGSEPRIVDNLYAGPHILELRRSGFRRWSKTLMVWENAIQEINVPLEPRPLGLVAPKGPTLVAGVSALSLLAAGLAFGLAANNSAQAFDENMPPNVDNIDRLRFLQDVGEGQATAANILFGLAGASLLTTGWLYWGDIQGEGAQQPTKDPSAAQNGAQQAPRGATKAAAKVVGQTP